MVKLRHPTLKRVTHWVPLRMVDAWVAVGWIPPKLKVSRPATERIKKVFTD